MKIFIEKFFILIFIIFVIQSKITQYDETNKLQKDSIQHQDRKLSYSPYLTAFEDYSAKKIGEQEQYDSQPYLGATPVGTQATNMSSIMPPSFSGGNVLPGSQMFPMDHLNFPSNVMTTALYNPLGGNPVLNAGNTSLAMQNQYAQSFQNFATQQFAPPIIKVEEKCQSVLKQAIKIAQTVMEKQFEQMASFIVNYLSVSRHSQEMNELQLTRQLRQDMFKHMQDYSNLKIKNIVFGPANGNLDINQDMLIKNIKRLANEDIDFKKPDVNNFVHKI